MTLLELVEDAVARIVFCREAIAVGELALAAAILRDLEEDLAVALELERAA